MNIFGITPIDASLASLGLVYAQDLVEFLFIQTSWGTLALAIGFLWSIWQSGKEANFKHFAIFIFIALSGVLLFVIPHYQPSSIKSAVEVYGTVPAVTAQSLKDSQTNKQTMPLIFSFINQMTDSLSFGAIYRVDALLNDEYRFLSDPFGIQRLSLETNQVLYVSLADAKLRKDLDEFLYAYYWPSLTMYINTNPSEDLKYLWAGDSRITHFYSSDAKNQWESIKTRLLTNIKDPQGRWAKLKNVLTELKIEEGVWEDALMSSIIRRQLHVSQERRWFRPAGSVYNFFPYIYGWANFCLYVSFPFLMLGMIVIRRFHLFLHYAEIFIWIKSWTLCAAISFYISLIAFQVQLKTSTQINWFWDYPYYITISSVLLILIPFLSFLVIHRSIQSISHNN